MKLKPNQPWELSPNEENVDVANANGANKLIWTPEIEMSAIEMYVKAA